MKRFLALLVIVFAAGAATPALTSSQINVSTITIVERAASGQTRTFEVALDPSRAKGGVCVGVSAQPPVTTHCTFYVLSDVLFSGPFDK